MKFRSLFIPVLILFSFCFFSCDSFLNSSALRQDIEEKVKIANAPYLKVEMVNGLGSTVSPIGEVSYKQGESWTISVGKDNDYQFIKWEVLLNNDVLPPEKSQIYVNISDIEEEITTATLLKSPEGKLSIRPLFYERPLILSKSPTETPGGSYKDVRISILFSQPMDEASIYFKNESELPSGAAPLYIDNNPSKPIYGYKKDGTTFFKNIDIKNIDTQNSILDCYGAPYFENPTRLIIPANKDNLPPSGSQILITLSKSMGSKVEGKTVCLSKNETWNYVVNSLIDNVPPSFDYESLSVTSYKQKRDSFHSLPELSPSPDISLDDFENLFIENNEVCIFGKVIDLGCGINNVSILSQKVYDRDFVPVKNSEVSEVSIPLVYLNGKNHANICENELFKENPFKYDISDYDEGVYKIWFNIEDFNGNRTSSNDDPSGNKVYYLLKNDKLLNEDFAYRTDVKIIPGKKGVKFSLKTLPELGLRAVLTYSNKNIFQNLFGPIAIELHSNEGGVFEYNGLLEGNVYDISIMIESVYGKKLVSGFDKQIMTYPNPPSNITSGLWEGELSKYCQVINDGTEIVFSSNKETKTYGRIVSMKAPQKASGWTVKYRLYDLDKNIVFMDNISSEKFDLDYSSSKGNKNYAISSYIEYEGEQYEGEKSAPFVFHETQADCVFIYTAYNTSGNRIGITSGFGYKKDRLPLIPMNQYFHWTRFEGRESSNIFTQQTHEGLVTCDMIHEDKNDTTFYFKTDTCRSEGCSFVYRMAESDTDPNYVEFGFTQYSGLGSRNVQFLWDGWTKK